MDNVRAVQSIRISASDVAKYLLEKKGTLTGYQLQKLLYYCQVWSIVVDDGPLFFEEMRAYEHGPAVPSVSMQHKHRFYVRASDISGDSNKLSESDAALIDTVFAAYGGMTGDELEDLTHSEVPWHASYNNRTGVNTSAVITHDLIREYYAKLLTATDEEQHKHHVPSFDHPKKLYVAPSDYDWLMGYLNEE